MTDPISQAREALELLHKWQQREQAWDAPRALDLDRASAALRALIDHAEQVERERDEACAQMTAVIRRALEAALGGES